LLHWDHHELVFSPPTWWDWTGGNPVQPTPAYHGTDGGIDRSGVDAAGGMTFTSLNEGIATSLLTSLDIGRGVGNNDATFAGMQDTGTGGHRAGDAARTWFEGIDGDGGPIAVDPSNPSVVFGTDNDSLIRSTNGGATWFTAGLPQVIPIDAVGATNPVTITTTGHSYRTGDGVTIAGVPGGALVNGAHTITVVDATTFTLNGVNGSAAAFGQLPTVTGQRYLTRHDIVAATLQNPIQIETATAHGCATGDKVRIDAVEGNVAANNDVARPSWTVTVISATRLSLDGSDGTSSSPYVPGTGRMRGPATVGTVPVFGTVRSNPIVVTAQGHELVSGDQVTIVGVTGNLAANVAGAVIRVLDANSFELVGVAGIANPGAMPRVFGRSIGRGLPVPAGNVAHFSRVAVEPGGASLATTTVYFSQDHTLYRSVNGGITFVPMAVFKDRITALHAPAVKRVWVGTSSIRAPGRFRVHLSTDGAVTWAGRAQNFVTDVGARSVISHIVEDPNVTTGQRVAVVTAGYSRTATQRRSRHVFLTSSGGTTTGGVVPWHEVGGLFNAASGNLPDVPVLGAAWDTTPATSELLVATDGGVLRLDPAGPTWKRVGPNLPQVSVQAIASDGAVIRIGTYGRSAWQLSLPTGPSLFVEGDLGFGDQQVGTTVRRRMVLHSVGDADVHATISGATGDVTVESVPPGAGFPVTVTPGEHRPFDVVFSPSAAGDRGAFLMVSSDDPAHPAVEMKVTGFGVAAGAPRLSVRAFLEFGVVQTGAPGDLPLEIRNVGDAPMTVTGVALDPGGSPRFSLVGLPAVPFPVPPSGVVPVTARFTPTANGTVRGAVVVTAGTQGQVVTLVGTGTTTAAGMVAVLFDLLGVGSAPEALA
jgi:hypothetical protein